MATSYIDKAPHIRIEHAEVTMVANANVQPYTYWGSVNINAQTGETLIAHWARTVDSVPVPTCIVSNGSQIMTVSHDSRSVLVTKVFASV